MKQNNIPKTNIGLQLATIIKLKRQSIDAQIKDLGISRTQWQALFWINKLGDCTQKELLNNLDIDAGHLARVLEKTEKAKYIIRTPLKEDRRSTFIQMTDHCKQNIMPQIISALDKDESLLLKNLNDDEVWQLIKLLSKLEQNIVGDSNR